jgi:hypothetical protein
MLLPLAQLALVATGVGLLLWAGAMRARVTGGNLAKADMLITVVLGTMLILWSEALR